MIHNLVKCQLIGQDIFVRRFDRIKKIVQQKVFVFEFEVNLLSKTSLPTNHLLTLKVVVTHHTTQMTNINVTSNLKFAISQAQNWLLS